MDLELKGKRAVVTGASDGIGLEVCRSLIAEGARVLGCARRPSPEVDGLDYRQADLTEDGASAALVEDAVERFGGLDILVNNAGAGRLRAGFASMTDEEWRSSLDLNLMTAVRAMRAALSHLADGGGVIVNIASVNATVPIVEGPDYSTSKAALLSAGRSVALEYARNGVRVVTVSPGPVNTPFWLGADGIAAQVEAATGTPAADVIAGTADSVPLGRFLEPAEVADAVTFLASARAGAITGTEVLVDGGYVQTM